MKETCSLVTDAYPMREFLHGPKQILDDSWDVFLLSQDNDVRAELSKLSRNVTDISDLLNSRFGIRIQDGLADSLVKVAFFQFLSYYKSVSLGLDPDKPSKLTKIISS
jgi:glucosamine--fructose-6-phosphate aminotransferase (isomerizing)